MGFVRNQRFRNCHRSANGTMEALDRHLEIVAKSANMAPTSQTYPRVNILTDGTLIMSGTGSITRKFDPTTNIWTTIGNLNYGNRIYGGVVLLPGLTKILTAGGHDTSTARQPTRLRSWI